MMEELDLDCIRQFAIKKYNEGRCPFRHPINGASLPYYYHPIDVESMVCKWGAGSSLMRAVSLLHDVLEDTDCTFEEMVSVSNSKVTNIVMELTLLDGHDKAEYLASFPNKSIEALVVKLADRFCNVLDYMAKPDAGYARKYYYKATSLFDTYRSRRQEIASNLGEQVMLNICRTHDIVRLVLDHDYAVI